MSLPEYLRHSFSSLPISQLCLTVQDEVDTGREELTFKEHRISEVGLRRTCKKCMALNFSLPPLSTENIIIYMYFH